MNLYLTDSEEIAADQKRYRHRAQQQLALLNAQEDHRLIYHGTEPHTVLRYLQRCVASAPQILRVHVRRVYLAIQCGDRNHLVGALVDLILVLNGRGRVLLDRILGQSEPLLTAEALAQLREIGISGDRRVLRKVPLSDSMLSEQ